MTKLDTLRITLLYVAFAAIVHHFAKESLSNIHLVYGITVAYMLYYSDTEREEVNEEFRQKYLMFTAFLFIIAGCISFTLLAFPVVVCAFYYQKLLSAGSDLQETQQQEEDEEVVDASGAFSEHDINEAFEKVFKGKPNVHFMVKEIQIPNYGDNLAQTVNSLLASSADWQLMESTRFFAQSFHQFSHAASKGMINEVIFMKEMNHLGEVASSFISILPESAKYADDRELLSRIKDITRKYSA